MHNNRDPVIISVTASSRPKTTLLNHEQKREKEGIFRSRNLLLTYNSSKTQELIYQEQYHNNIFLEID